MLSVSYVYVDFINFWTPFTLWLPQCARQNKLPYPSQDVYILIPETWEFVVLFGKGELRLSMELRLLIS